MDYLLSFKKVNAYLEKEIKMVYGEVRDLKVQKCEKDNTIYELNKKLSELENEILEMDKTLGMMKSFKEDYLGEFEEEIQVLQDKKFEKTQLISGLNKMLIKLSKYILEDDRMLRKCMENVKYLKGVEFTTYQMINEMKSEESKVNDQIHKPENQVMEEDQIVRMYEERMNGLKGIVGQLKSEIKVLKDEKLAADRVAEMFKDQLSGLKGIVGQLDSEIQVLKAGKLAADQMVSEMASELLVASDERNKISSECEEKMGKLKDQILEKDTIVEVHKKKLSRLTQKARQVIKEIKILKRQVLRDDDVIEEMKSELLKANNDNNKIISELNEEIRKLKDQAYITAEQAEREIQGLNHMRYKANNATEGHLAVSIVDGLRSQVLVPTNGAGNQVMMQDSGNRVIFDLNTLPMDSSHSNNSTKHTSSGMQKTGSKEQEDEQIGFSEYNPQGESSDVYTGHKYKRLKKTGAIDGKDEQTPCFISPVVLFKKNVKPFDTAQL